MTADTIDVAIDEADVRRRRRGRVRERGLE
jgi:hypothetical protein